MVSDECPQSNHFQAEPPRSHNGTQPHTATIDSDERQYSNTYRAIKAGLDAWEMWQELDVSGKLNVILTHYSAAQWLEEDELQVLAHFRHQPPGKWAQIKLKYKEIGGSPHDLQYAVDQLLKLQPIPYGSETVPCATFQPITATELYTKDLPQLAYVVEDILPSGATLFVGRAKDGKSLAMWNLCMAVAEGGRAFGRYPAKQGDVLYLALEDGERRAKKRLTDQMQAMGMTTPPARLSLVLWEAPRLGEGLEKALTQWLDAHSEAKLIVIDILEKVRPRRTRNGSVYQEDYLALAPLQRLAQERGIAIVIVHHANKRKAEDFRDAISGSMALAGAADSLWVLQRLAGEADAALHITGRDIETLDLALQFRDGFWTGLGDAEEYRLSQASKEVLDALRSAGKPMTPKQLAILLGVLEGTMRLRLKRMTERSEVHNLGDGRYIPRCLTAPMSEDEGVTHVTPVTQVTESGAPEVTQERVTGSLGECNADVTRISDEKNKSLEDLSYRVTGVTPEHTSCVDGQCQPHITSHQNGTSHTALILPCIECGGIYRWNDRGTMRCVRCWPPRQL